MTQNASSLGIILPWFSWLHILFHPYIPPRLGRPLSSWWPLAHGRVQELRPLLPGFLGLHSLTLLPHQFGSLRIFARQKLLKVGASGKRLRHKPVSADEHGGDTKI